MSRKNYGKGQRAQIDTCLAHPASREPGFVLSSDGPYASYLPDRPELAYAVHKVHEQSVTEHALARCALNAEALRDAYRQMRNPMRRRVAQRDLDHVILHGLRGPASDAVLECTEWGYPLDGVRANVLLWHGTRDRDVPIEVGVCLSEALGSACVSKTFIEGESHTLIRRHWAQVLNAVVQVAQGEPNSDQRF